MAATAAIAGAIAGTAQAAGGLGSTIYSTERNISNANYQADLNRRFEYNMASTQYQRAVKDMEAAGLNPAAIGSGLNSNAAPSGSAATGNYGHIGSMDFGNIFSSAAKAAMAEDRNVANKIIQEMKSETALGVQSLKNEGAIQNEIQKKALGHSAYQAANKNYDVSSKHRSFNFEEG